MARTLKEIRAGRLEVDEAKLDATTEEDIQRHMLEDGFDPDQPFDGLHPIIDPVAVRQKLGLTREGFADALRIPLATLARWEQGAHLDPAAQSLLRAVAHDPSAVLAAIAA